MQIPYSGRYINLDRSIDRRKRIERQLHELGIEHAYSRFSAIDGLRATGAPGTISSREYGCFASHAQLIKEACSARVHLHALEDDALLSPEFFPVVANLIGRGILDQFDILFTDVFVSWNASEIEPYERARRTHTFIDPYTGQESLKGVTIFDLRHRGWAATSSYVVSQRSLGLIAELLDKAMAARPTRPVDLVLRDLVDAGVLRAACIVPFVTSIHLTPDTHSTVHGGADGPNMSRLACAVIRQTLFVRPDWPSIDRILEQYFPPEAPSPRRQAVGRMMDFAVFGNARSF